MSGNSSIIDPESGSSVTGRSGHGYIRITVIKISPGNALVKTDSTTWKEQKNIFIKTTSTTWKPVKGIWAKTAADTWNQAL